MTATTTGGSFAVSRERSALIEQAEVRPRAELETPAWLVWLLRGFDPRWLAAVPPVTGADVQARSGIQRVSRDLTRPLRERIQEYYRQNRGALVGEARRLLRSQEDVNEVIQEAMRKVLTKIPDLRDPDALGAYLRTAVRNEARTRISQEIRHREMRFTPQSPETELDTLIPDHRPSVEDRVVQNLVVATALGELSPRERQLVLLVDHDGYTLQDAADCMGIAVGTAKRCRWNAHQKLRKNEAIRQLRPVA
jgi:RNA polymerase sigma factor (sigma-70 family)